MNSWLAEWVYGGALIRYGMSCSSLSVCVVLIYCSVFISLTTHDQTSVTFEQSSSVGDSV